MPIGLDRLVKLQWLEQTVFLALAGNDAMLIKSVLQENLKTSFRSSNVEVRGSVSKTITIMSRIWVNPPIDIEPLRIRGLELLKSLSGPDRISVHWGMVTAVYPFWSSVATQVGRLLRLQGSAAAAQVQRRICEQYGERETVSRRTRYVLRSFVDWGILSESNEKGIYSPVPLLPIADPKLTAWLIEASLHARANGSAPLRDLIESPSLFPFRVKPIHPESLRAPSSRLDILYHGLDNDLVMLQNQPTRDDTP